MSVKSVCVPFIAFSQFVADTTFPRLIYSWRKEEEENVVIRLLKGEDSRKRKENGPYRSCPAWTTSSDVKKRGRNLLAQSVGSQPSSKLHHSLTMPSVDPSSDGEQSCCSSSWSSSSTSSTTRDRQRMRQLKWSWAHEQRHQPINHHNREQSFSAFRRRSGSRRQSSQSRMTKEEYLRLKQMVPAVATQPRVSKVILQLYF